MSVISRFAVIAFIATVVGPATASAAPGVIELSQACAATGCTGGDPPGFPINLSQPGSYRLTSNLHVDHPDLDAIAITAHGALIDLGGFQISGPCDPPTPCGGITAGGSGVLGGSESHVRNGTIRGFKGNGITLIESATVEDLILENNQKGVQVFSGLIRRSLIQNNTSFGISLVTGGIVEHNMVLGNGDSGIFLDNSTPPVGELIVRFNLIRKNVGHGIEAQRGALIEGNHLLANLRSGILSPITTTLDVGSLLRAERNAICQSGETGISVGANAQIIENTVASSQGDGIHAGAGALVVGSVAFSNTGRGFDVGDGSAVLESVARANGSTGIRGGEGCVIRSNLAQNSGSSGISAGAGAQVSENVSNDNALDGITLGGAGRAFGNVTASNDRFGLGLNASAGYAENITNDNGTAEVFSGVSTGINVCGGNTTCP